MKASDIGELLLLAALWGGSFLFMRIAAPVLGPVWLIDLRMLLAGFALLPVLIAVHSNRYSQHLSVKRLEDSDKIPQPVAKQQPVVRDSCQHLAAANRRDGELCTAFHAVGLCLGFFADRLYIYFECDFAFIWGDCSSPLVSRKSSQLNRVIGFVLGFVGVAILIGWKDFVDNAYFYGGLYC